MEIFLQLLLNQTHLLYGRALFGEGRCFQEDYIEGSDEVIRLECLEINGFHKTHLSCYYNRTAIQIFVLLTSFTPSGSWYVGLIIRDFWPIDSEAILAIPLGLGCSTDRMIWHYEMHGKYTVKSGYRWLMKSKTSQAESTAGYELTWWKTLWSLAAPLRYAYFYGVFTIMPF
ncbi:CCHC-type domain-containing protein [Abeliophyllum distichum]|uniref:CCHC-type domain-containing protein n=1 Tax=Abeliophyllum distichum TaxID=126358 RepID=A0ABD1NSJ8_9LAMI